MTTIALITDEASLPDDYDMPLLLEACDTVGLRTAVCHWDDPANDWTRFDAAVIRSSWTYMDRLPEFLAWCARTAELTTLLNPPCIARWVLDKHYLADLDARGVPVVPSTFVDAEADPVAAVEGFLAEHPRVGEFVVKPTIGAYSRGVRRFARSAEADAAAHIAKLIAGEAEVIVQPYLDSVDGNGETDLVFFDQVYSHAIRKGALLMRDGTVNVPTADFRAPRVAEQDERAVASAALDATVAHLGLTDPLLYGRVDLVRGDDGVPRVLELDLCEPSLNLPLGEGSALRFAEAIRNRLERGGSSNGHGAREAS